MWRVTVCVFAVLVAVAVGLLVKFTYDELTWIDTRVSIIEDHLGLGA